MERGVGTMKITKPAGCMMQLMGVGCGIFSLGGLAANEQGALGVIFWGCGVAVAAALMLIGRIPATR